MKILVVNVGSSSIKYRLFNMEDETIICKGLLDRIGIPGTVLEYKMTGRDRVNIKKDIEDHATGMKMILESLTHTESGCISSLDEIEAIGHRVVHGGEHFTESVVISDEVIRVISGCCDIAPLHNPPNVVGINVCQELMPGIEHVAVFDTAFHQTMSPEHYIYALPYEVYEEFKVRRYGFHGISHDYVSHRAAELLGKTYEQCKIISIHLGNGASMAAIKNGKTIDTSMGFTPLEGLVMGTRCGDIDPAIVYFIMDKLNLDAKEADNYFNKQTGLLGLSGISSDMRDVMDAANSGDERARLALDIYCLRVKGYIGNYMAKLNGCDCLVFTAGVGENGCEIREKICQDLDGLGIEIDVEQNRVRGMEADISAVDSNIKILVIPTNEELVIARETFRLLKQSL
ncbi:acetate kinase [Peptoclostridium litorale DSM 5388]|uniref:Acetate kinase n=1 Tax=Peptoclostridium litorale DSM 5388 TaxID=1121324 RepID=A0A069RK77_PEPLI|nr:acetate kinase [Peptoclostridium litorale]KDR96535.1 acetate kinase AckA [Peptoclostridium litorale DSM 5388]SIN69442.1 acetate kinase [Peptoclostridium litorale DSM 5388]